MENIIWVYVSNLIILLISYSISDRFLDVVIKLVRITNLTSYYLIFVFATKFLWISRNSLADLMVFLTFYLLMELAARSKNLFDRILVKWKIVSWYSNFLNMKLFDKYLLTMYRILAGLAGIRFLYLIGSILFKKYYPHHYFSPEVDASILSTIGSVMTISITLIVTFYFNKQTQMAMIEQSRANLKERVIEKRIQVYPEIEQSIQDVVRKYLFIPFKNGYDEWIDKVEALRSLFIENKYYLSKPFRGHIKDMLDCCERIMEDQQKNNIYEVHFPIHERLNTIAGLCQEEIEKSLDLAALVDID
ncbi:hypothetical protein [Risungbinella massiliensis]|uniref:hypothetical protein n=1 Tax=Risungbinella massiliensis TaxID=1329796 RepID=UPI0005CC3A67|nr:hypothetical protein [Risungbinella massiliensis]